MRVGDVVHVVGFIGCKHIFTAEDSQITSVEGRLEDDELSALEGKLGSSRFLAPVDRRELVEAIREELTLRRVVGW